MIKDYELRDYLTIIRKRMTMLILITLVMSALSGIISIYCLEPTYETYATLLIGRPKGYEGRLEYSDLLLSKNLAVTYGEIARSRYVSNRLVNTLYLNLSYEQIKEKISVTQVNDTEIIKIIVADESPERAAEIANGISRIFMEYVSEIMQIDNIQFIDMAEIPKKPVKPKVYLNVTIAAAAGLICGILLAMLIEYLDNTVKTQDDIEKCFALPVIGVIPKIS